VRSVLVCPILRKGELRGIVHLENDAVVAAFSHDRLEMINLLLGQAAIALENASLYRNQLRYTDELELRVKARTIELEQANLALARLAEIDGLTQIANRRQFDRLAAQFEKEGFGISLILCDVDFFKAYNDNYGHPAGDEVLRRVAAVIGGLSFDFPTLAARYGGEEFVLLMKTADTDLVLDAARRTVAAVQKLELKHEHSKAAPCVTLSVGAAIVWRSEVGSIEQLKARADAALYAAKRAGKNRALLWDPQLSEKS
jgi:diguanylate cyclase (GGDEF)-like protein